jgi:hypothetical protein
MRPIRERGTHRETAMSLKQETQRTRLLQRSNTTTTHIEHHRRSHNANTSCAKRFAAISQ